MTTLMDPAIDEDAPQVGVGGSDDDAQKSRLADLAAILSQRQPRPTAQLREGRTDWYRIENHADLGSADIYIYDEIGYWGVTASDFVGALNAVTASQINVHINSPGGEVFDGVAIYNALLQHPAMVTSYVDGIAASAASFIAMAGAKIVMARNATMMIHDASGICIGDAATMRQTGELLDKISDNIAGIYADKTGGTVADWRTTMQQTAWYNAAEALAAGLVDEVTDAPERAATAPANTWDLSIFARADRAESQPTDPAPAQPEPVVDAAPEPAPTPDPVPAFVWDADQVRAALQALKSSPEEAVQ